MSISFERFLALTAALATASSVMTGCGDDDGTTTAGGAGGKAGKGGTAGRAGSGAGKSSGGSAGSSAGEDSGGTGGKGGKATGGSAGKGAGGTAGKGSGAKGGKGGKPAGGNGGSSAASGDGGESGAAASGGTSGSGTSGTGGTGGTGGTAGEAGEGGQSGGGGQAGDGGQSGEGGSGGLPEICFGDEGQGTCFPLPSGELPTDECPSGPNPMFRSCAYSEFLLLPGLVDGLGACLVEISSPCSFSAAVATDACEREALSRACPTIQAADICANGLDIGGPILGSPLTVCNDGTLNQTSCTRALSAVSSSYLQDVVTCSDPASEYGSYLSGTCAERLQQCIFPHGNLYP